jgi:type IV secretory pathway protease TraF
MQRCGRCGSNLAINAVTVDVLPPRASRRQKWTRRNLGGLLHGRNLVASAGNRLASAVLNDRFVRDVPAMSVVWRMIVPGWAHAFAGQPVRGRLFLTIWLALLLPGLLLMGSFLGSVLIGLAFSCHAAAALDLILRDCQDLGQRLACTVIAWIALFAIIYAPAGWLIGQVANPYVIVGQFGGFQRGDVLLVNRSMEPRVGSVVLYDAPRIEVSGYTETGYPAVYVIEGPQIDRILAAPGQHVVWKDGTLMVDGRPSEQQPLDSLQLRFDHDSTVPAGHWLLIPSSAQNLTPEAVPRLMHIPESRIAGTVYARTQPLTRIRWID